MRLKVDVQNKIPRRLDDYNIVCGNDDYEILFSFDSEWDEHVVKTARFNYLRNGEKKYINVPFDGVLCKVPPLYGIKSVEVGVFAGDLKTTTMAVIKCEKSALCDSGVPEEPTEDVYNQIMALFNEKIVNGSVPIDQEYDAQSENPQSGKALRDVVIKTLTNPKVWELDIGVYRVKGRIIYATNPSGASVAGTSVDCTGVTDYAILVVYKKNRFVSGETATRYFMVLFDDSLLLGRSSPGFFDLITGETTAEGAITDSIYLNPVREITPESTDNYIPTAKAVHDLKKSTIMTSWDFEGDDDQITEDLVPSMMLFYYAFAGHEERIMLLEESLQQVCNLINSANALGRSNLAEKGVELPENATTYEIMQGIASIVGSEIATAELAISPNLRGIASITPTGSVEIVEE